MEQFREGMTKILTYFLLSTFICGIIRIFIKLKSNTDTIIKNLILILSYNNIKFS